jgi:hypothetical protein
MFDMTATQKKAATDAMNGFSPDSIAHLLLFCIGAAATIWFLFVFIGVWQGVKDRKTDIGEALYKLGVSTFILICVGSLIYF